MEKRGPGRPPNPKPESAQDQAVLADRPPEFRKLTDLLADELTAAGMATYQTGAERKSVLADGREFRFWRGPVGDENRLVVECWWIGSRLAHNSINCSQLAAESGPALLRTVIATVDTLSRP